ncbi:hypothetical protein JR316_0005139 [Psilocybe cubensis]|uniref:Uncharacterized protein n=2 Tax=Psilocybe cubensis TaxID=181762 RepID=A0A8H7Y164_PSICU|nr:hypothetical protein JR316_0005139 [Psilocybe cubensis]KAH9483039.1 hypothetical protein JR316_0005139 [Psilocybe cubensis]
MESLEEHRVYHYTKGRTLGQNTGGTIKDIIAEGMHILTKGKKIPLTDYNKAFQKLQKQQQLWSMADQALQLFPSTPPDTKPNVRVLSTTPFHPLTPIQPISSAQECICKEETMVDTRGEPEEEEKTKFERLLDEVEQGEKNLTLPHIFEEDVSFDMNEVFVDEGKDEEELSKSEYND